VRGPLATRDAFQHSNTATRSVELTGAFGAFFYASAGVMYMTVFLAFATSNQNV
jgi:hypothetical protein